jgi:predicted O-methyltransferase YrrM
MLYYDLESPEFTRTLSEGEMDKIRESFLSRELALYRAFLPPKVLQTLDSMLQDVSFPGATDCSALSLLSIVIKVCQPSKILQFGTYIGFSAIVFAGLLSKNVKPGKVWTVEPIKSNHNKAKHYARKAGVEKFIEFIDGSSTDPNVVELLETCGPYNLVYIDSSHEYGQTLQELRIYLEGEKFTHLSSLVALHDAGSEASAFDPTSKGGVPEAIKEWISFGDNRKKYQLFTFEPPLYPNPCGLAMIRKVQ